MSIRISLLRKIGDFELICNVALQIFLMLVIFCVVLLQRVINILTVLLYLPFKSTKPLIVNYFKLAIVKCHYSLSFILKIQILMRIRSEILGELGWYRRHL